MGRIKINERFSIERDSECWNLIETKQGVNPKTKEPTTNERRRYFPNLHTVIDHMLDIVSDEADDLKGLRDTFLRCRSEIIAAVRR